MTVCKLLLMGHKLLEKPSEHITREELLSPETQQVHQNMLRLCQRHSLPYLTAVQIGYPWQMALVNQSINSNQNDYLCLINPKIKVLSQASNPHTEECLSMPQLKLNLFRYQKIQVEFLELSFKHSLLIIEDLLAARIQHVYDHLQGILPTQKLKRLQDIAFTQPEMALEY